MASNIGLSKVFILDKYFKELQKFWQTEKMLQGMWINIIKYFFLLFSSPSSMPLRYIGIMNNKKNLSRHQKRDNFINCEP